MSKQKKIQVPEEDVSQRLDVFLAFYFEGEFSRSQIKQWIDKKNVQVNGRIVKANRILKAEDEILFEPLLIEESTLKGEDIPIEIVYEDDDLLVVNKPPGLVVHPACGNPSHTLVNALIHHTQKNLSKGSSGFRPGIVHRLDKDTSGLLVVAKNDWTHERLAKQFEKRTINRTYWVVVQGVVQHDELRCEEPLGRSHMDRRKVIVEPVLGKNSVSFFFVKERFHNATLLEAKLETGRTHQIRVHLKYLGHAVIGDRDYGLPSDKIHRQALHAKTLEFCHPRTGKTISFDSKVPDDFAELLKKLKENKEEN